MVVYSNPLMAVADYFVGHQNSLGKYSGLSFVDNRAARGCLAAYDLSGNGRFLESAIAWGEGMLREQRDDGGYRMGYGFFPGIGEACYVADGGEIAVGIARLMSYAPESLKKGLMDSLKAYFAYRESFRVESGGIGAGYCLKDAGALPMRRLEKIEKVFRPEQNPYTIGCSLAGASAYAVLTGDPEIRQRAIDDAWWMLDHIHSFTGAYMESVIWAHHFLEDDELSEAIGSALKETFRCYALNLESRWWTSGGGRTVLSIDGVIYYLREIEDDAELRSALEILEYELCSPLSETNVLQLLSKKAPDTEEWRYLAYGSLVLADLQHPMITMKPLV